jgi:hypothetical protein
VTIFDAAAGRRIQRLRFGTSARDTDASETDARVDRWELLHDRLAGVSRRAGTDPTTIAVYLLDPQQTTTAAAPPDRYTMPNGRADNIWFANDALVLGGAGAVVSFAAPVPRIGARP